MSVTIYNLALLGHPVSHSISPEIHRSFLDKTGLKGGYVCIDCTPDQLQNTVRYLQGLGFRGANVTIPHKEKVLDLVDEISEEARCIGACNTLVFDRDKITAHNTDAVGFLASVPALGEPDPGRGLDRISLTNS